MGSGPRLGVLEIYPPVRHERQAEVDLEICQTRRWLTEEKPNAFAPSLSRPVPVGHATGMTPSLPIFCQKGKISNNMVPEAKVA